MDQFSFLRILLFVSFGAVFHGPLGHIFYGKLNKIFPKSTDSEVAKKVRVFSPCQFCKHCSGSGGSTGLHTSSPERTRLLLRRISGSLTEGYSRHGDAVPTELGALVMGHMATCTLCESQVRLF
jgi:hypothetical protein